MNSTHKLMPTEMNQIYISLGSNIDKEKNTAAGLQAMQAAFGELKISPVYESESVGFSGSAFYNLVAAATTPLPLPEVCQILKEIERNNGRIVSEKKFAPRTLDLDLLLFNDLIIEEPIVLPRAEILYNAFVLLPLTDLIPNQVHPVAGKTYQELWNTYNKNSQKLWQIDFHWKT